MQIIKFNSPAFRHSDLKIVANKIKIKKMKNYYINCSKNLHKLNKEFITKKYSLFNFDKTLFYSNSRKKMMRRSQILSEIVSQYFKDKNIKILDYGCNKGHLLKELKRLKYKNLFGFDLLNIYGKYLKKINAEYSKKISKFKEKFDLVILNHTISYTNNLERLMKNIKKISKKNSHVLINLQNISKRPINFLYGDQKYHFNKRMIINFFGKIGNIRFIYHDSLEHEFIIILKLSKKYQNKSDNIKDPNEIKKLQTFIQKIKDINYKCNVFGLNIISALCITILNKRVKRVVMNGRKGFFFKKKIINANQHSEMRIPLLMSNNKILKSHQYKNLTKNSLRLKYI